MRTLLHLGAAVAVAVIPAAASLAANAHWPDQPPHQMAHLGELKLEGGGVICSDALGATQIGYEHSTSPTNSGLKMKFPQYHQRDMVKASTFPHRQPPKTRCAFTRCGCATSA